MQTLVDFGSLPIQQCRLRLLSAYIVGELTGLPTPCDGHSTHTQKVVQQVQMKMMTLKQFFCFGMLLAASYADQFCTSSGACIDASAPSKLSQRTRVCEPASECDADQQLQHHSDNDIENDIGVGCESTSNPDTTRAQGFLRCFEGNLCSESQVVQAVAFGVDALDVDDLDVSLNFFKGNAGDCASKNSVRDLNDQDPTATFDTTVDAGELVDVVVDVSSLGLTLSPSESVLVEVSVGDLRDVGKFFLGANTAEECDDSYIRATDCGAPEPTPLSEIQSNNIVSYLIRLDVNPDNDGDGVADDDKSCFGSIFEPFVCAFNFLFGCFL